MLRRIAPAVLATAVLAAGLTGCTATTGAEVDRGDCAPGLGAGSLSDSVVVLGGFGTEPQVKIPVETAASVAQRTIVESGADGGTVANAGAIVSWNYAFYDQASGEQIAASAGFGTNDSAAFMIVPGADALDPISAALRCSVAGDRVVSAYSPSDSQGLAQALGLASAPKRSIVGVFDVVAVSEQQAEGALRGLPSGFPAVVTNEDGVPGVVLPPRPAQAGMVSAIRIAGDGAEVQATDRVVLQALTIGWDGTVQSSTWDTGSVQPAGTEEEAKLQGDTVRAALTGVPVGSQVVITEGGDNARVHVIDVLAAG